MRIFASIYLHIMEARRDVFQAIADPTRRDIINLLAAKPQNLNAIADNFDVTRQAISLHVKILNECGLIIIRKEGRERYCEVQLEKLREVHAWTEQYRAFWTTKLRALKNFVEEDVSMQADSKENKPIKKTTKTNRK